jgi:hypothetical protein
MSDPSIDPSLARPLQSSIQNDAHLQQQPRGVLSSDIFNTTFEGGPDPAAYQIAAAALQQAAAASAIPPPTEDEESPNQTGGKRGSKSKKSGPLIRKRSGWNSFYKEQFAIYHAHNPPKSKQNARERTGFSSYAAQMWKQLSPAQKEAYVQRAGEDDALAVSRPVEKLRRKRAGLLETLGRIVAELEIEFGVESLIFWSEREIPTIQPDGSTPTVNEGEAYGIVGSTTGSRFIEILTAAQLGPREFQTFIQQNQPQEPTDPTQQTLLPGAKKRKTLNEMGADLAELTGDDLDLAAQLKKKAKSNISRDYHDAEFRRLLLALLNSHLSPQSQKSRLPRGFFGPYMEKHGLELIGLPEKPMELGEGGKIGGWSADALRRNLEAIKSNRVFIRRVGQADNNGMDMLGDFTIEEQPEPQGIPDESAGVQEEEAARILAEGAGGNRRARRAGAK